MSTLIATKLVRTMLCALPLVLLIPFALPAQQDVRIEVDLSKPVARFEPVWAWVRHDEPNYTYSEKGPTFLRNSRILAPILFTIEHTTC